MRFNSESALNIADLRAIAKRRLPKAVFEYVDRGTEDDYAVRMNPTALDRVKLRPRVLVDVSGRNCRSQIFGKPARMPVIIAPTGMAGILWYDGEIALARAAARFGVPCTLATGSVVSLERVAEAGGDLWFQLYVSPDRSLSHDLISRAKAAGYKALVVTVDTAESPNREYNQRNGFTIPYGINSKNWLDLLGHPSWLIGVIARYLMTSGMPGLANLPANRQTRDSAVLLKIANDLTWDELKNLRRLWDGPLVLKGILHPDDASMAVQAGFDGIVVSNHGGRNLDDAISPISVLGDIVERGGSDISVFVDSGFIRGADIVKALALGAEAVMIGRAPLWGVAAGGEAGATRALEVLENEINKVMGFIGCSSVDALNSDFVSLERS
jgi:isopentenyl diphosphate isomerase/L-lactate dehydrogenase-like FMN-dependent dehydrogenase